MITVTAQAEADIQIQNPSQKETPEVASIGVRSSTPSNSQSASSAPDERLNEEDAPVSLEQFVLPGFENGPFRIQVQRHDDHNLDIRSLLEFDNTNGISDLTLFIYMPPSAHLSTVDKNRIMADFFSRGRLFYSRAENLKNEDLVKNADKITKLVSTLREIPTEGGAIDSEELTSLVRVYGSILGELVKTSGERQKRFLMMSHSLLSQVADLSRLMDDLAREIRITYELSGKLREFMDASVQDMFPVLKVLENYTHHLYVDYLGNLQDALNDLKKTASDQTRFLRGWDVLQKVLSEFRAVEAQRASAFLELGDVFHDRQDQERVILRYSHMKKFFQSTTFVDVARKENIKRLNEPIAAISAAIAMAVSIIFGALLAVVFLGGFDRLASGMMNVSGVAMIVAVIVYTIKDRLKEAIKKMVLQKVSKMVPDVEQDLYSEGKKLGSVREWFAHKVGSEVPQAICQLRRTACISEPEKHLHEDVLYYKKQIRMDQENSGREGRFFQDLLRINFERYLKYFDDHEKSFRFLDRHGNVSTVKTHRVYHFHLGVEMSLKTGDGSTTSTRFFRIVMDKNGIDRVEPIH